MEKKVYLVPVTVVSKFNHNLFSLMQVSSQEFVDAVLGQEQFSKMLTLEIMNIFIDGSK